MAAAVSFIGRHSLVIYIAHMGFYHTALPYSVPPWVLFVWVLAASILWSALLTSAYIWLTALARQARSLFYLPVPTSST